MRVLYLSRGRGIHEQRFLRAFVSFSFETAFVSISGEDKVPVGITDLGSLISPGATFTADLDRAVRVFMDRVMDYSPSLILAGPVHDAGFLAANAGLEVPVIVQSWAFDVTWDLHVDYEARARAERALAKCDGCFADCEAILKVCETIRGRSFSHSIVMPWGLDVSEMPEKPPADQARIELGIRGEQFVFLCTRGMEAIYGADILISAFLAHSRRFPNSLLLWAGGGTQWSEISRRLDTEGCSTKVKLLGVCNRETIAKCFAAADCYVSCSASDGTSVSLLEAMAEGLPAIVSSAGGNSEWVTSGMNGWVVPVFSREALELAMDEAIGTTVLHRERMGKISQRLVSVRADWFKNTQLLCKFLKSTATGCQYSALKV